MKERKMERSEKNRKHEEKSDEPMSIDQVRQKKKSIIKTIIDNALIISRNDDHIEHLLGNIPRDILESVYSELDRALCDKYFKVRYSKSWSYFFPSLL